MKTRNYPRNTIGANIKKLREYRNYTQQYMADRLGISVTAYGDIERGKSGISQSRIEEIARILNVPYTQVVNFDLDELINGQSAGNGSAAFEELRQATQHVLHRYDQLLTRSLRQQEELIKILLGKFYMSLTFLLQAIPASLGSELTELSELIG